MSIMERNKSKRKIVVCGTLVLMGIMSGCSSEEETEVFETVNRIEANVSYGDNMVTMLENDETTTIRYAIKYYNPQNGGEMYACGLANCEHDMSKESDMKCNAIIDEEVYYPFLYKDELYFISGETQYSLWKSNADGSNKQKVTNITFSPNSGRAMVYDGKLYAIGEMTTWGEEDKNGTNTVASQKSEVYSIDLDSGEEEQITELGTKASANLNMECISDGKLIIRYAYQNKSVYDCDFESIEEYLNWSQSENGSYANTIKMFDGHSDYYTIDLETKEKEKLEFNYKSEARDMEGIEGYYDFSMICMDDEFCYYATSFADGCKIYKYNLKDDTAEIIENSYRIYWAYNDGKIYITKTKRDDSKPLDEVEADDVNTPPVYEVYDIKNEKMQELELDYNLDGKIFIITSVGKDYIYGNVLDFIPMYRFEASSEFVAIKR